MLPWGTPLLIPRGGRPPCLAEAAREPFLPGLAGDVHMWGITPVMDPACPAEAARTIFSSCPTEAVYKGGAPPWACHKNFIYGK